MSGRVLRAQLSLRCCGTTAPERTAGPCWQLYIIVPGLVSEWPVFTWPTGPDVPSREDRAAALASLGFTFTDGAEWEWSEDSGPPYHPHPVRVALIAATKVQPVSGGAG
ncbi:DUF6303 family protein [Streptomyces sp. CAI 127]|uniref:DUF6303 family protein n=1 Tax=Streptomyces sp. CAI 127 TaxID=1076397 RepID=UPI00158799CA|nr:DUF6303 family protein [Streptomyces sp. CAI 127]NUW04536.1 hypothetical protein [Streptomyces sp. CAI 127]